MTRIIPALIVVAIVGLVLALGQSRADEATAARSITTPTAGQIEAQFVRTQECRRKLGKPGYPTSRGWETAKRGPYFIWMHDLWRKRVRTCRAELERASHVHPLVAARVVFPEWTWERWRIIIGCETGWTYSNAVRGDAGETSGFQIHPASHPWYDAERGARDALYAAQSAKRVLHSQGWGAWTCARIHGLA